MYYILGLPFPLLCSILSFLLSRCQIYPKQGRGGERRGPLLDLRAAKEPEYVGKEVEKGALWGKRWKSCFRILEERKTTMGSLETPRQYVEPLN